MYGSYSGSSLSCKCVGLDSARCVVKCADALTDGSLNWGLPTLLLIKIGSLSIRKNCR